MKAEEISLQLMARYKNWGQHRFVCWSGGKDSTLVLHLGLRIWGRDNFKAVFVDTGITLPETLAFIEQISQAWNVDLIVVRPARDFWDYAKRHGFPSVKALWCRSHFKIRPLKRCLEQFKGWKLQALGIRREESIKRMRSEFYKRDFIVDRKIRYAYSLHPIRNWTDRDVAAYYRKHGLPVNPAYRLYGTSGCYYCPFVTNKRYYLTLRRTHPDLFDRILEAELAMKTDFLPLRNVSFKELAKQQELRLMGASPHLLSVLERLGYTKIAVRNGALHARRGRDHLIIKLSQKGTVKAVTGHVDVYDRTQLPFSKHRALKGKFTEKLVSEFRLAYKS